MKDEHSMSFSSSPVSGVCVKPPPPEMRLSLFFFLFVCMAHAPLFSLMRQRTK